MESLTGSKRLSRASSNYSNRMSFMTELRSKRDRSDTASLLTVDEITAEVENRRQSMAVDMGVEGAEDWTKIERDIDDVSDLLEDAFDEDEEDEEQGESEEETGKTMTCSSGTYRIYSCAGFGLHCPKSCRNKMDQGCAHWGRIIWQSLSWDGCHQRTVDGCQAG